MTEHADALLRQNSLVRQGPHIASGGPVDHVINGYGYAVGTVTAAQGGTLIACTYNTFSTCYTTLYTTDMGYTLLHYNAKMNYQ